jgi:hypothetical protein
MESHHSPFLCGFSTGRRETDRDPSERRPVFHERHCTQSRSWEAVHKS